jgi:catechol 2,3-dioxygenase
MPAEIELGAPTLRIRDLEQTLAFYEKDFGLNVGGKYRGADALEEIRLGFDGKNGIDPLMILKHDPNAKRTPNSAGLYHFAIRVPDRKRLASTYVGLGNSGAYFEGFADHLVSEALYLSDPDGNGIEIYRDRPRKEWKRDEQGNILQATQPLNIDSLLSELTPEERKNARPFPTGAVIGHIHLKVTHLERSIRFYHEKLGLDITWNLGTMGAAFLSAGRYHHHIGLNTWQSLGGPPHRKGDAGLENFRIRVPDRNVMNALTAQIPNSVKKKGQLLISDPDGIQITVESKSGASTPRNRR